MNTVHDSDKLLEVIIEDTWDIQEVPVSSAMIMLGFLQKIGVADKCLEWDEYEEKYIVSRDAYNMMMRIDMSTWIWDDE